MENCVQLKIVEDIIESSGDKEQSGVEIQTDIHCKENELLRGSRGHIITVPCKLLQGRYDRSDLRGWR